MLAKRNVRISVSGRRRANPRTYPSTSMESLPNPPEGDRLAPMSSVNIAGSRGVEP